MVNRKDKNNELIRLYRHTKDRAYLDQLFELNKGMIFNMAKKAEALNGRLRPLCDEYQEVALLFMDVIERYFDPNRGIALSTYFYKIFGKNFKRSKNSCRLIRVPINCRSEKALSVKTFLDSQKNINSSKESKSRSVKWGNSEFSNVYVQKCTSKSILNELSNREVVESIWNIAEKILDDRDYRIFYAHFVESKSNIELAKEFKCSRELIRQRLESSMTSIRNYMIENDIFLSAFDEEI